MTTGVENAFSVWRPVSDLKHIDSNISEYGYTEEFIDAHKLREKKSLHWGNRLTGQVCFFEPLEVMESSGIVFYRENDKRVHMEESEFFQTQFGVFNNHNHGEFTSWLGKDDYAGLPEEEKEIHRLYGREDYFVSGNFCDMFDCGEYSYAISNLMHMGLGEFKIVRINKNYVTTDMFSSFSEPGWTCLEYFGHFKNEHGHVIIASGFTEKNPAKSKERVFKKRTILFQITNDGDCSISEEWGIQLPSLNSFVVKDHLAYFGHNKMVSRLNLRTGELNFYTDKTEEELAALHPMM